MQSAIKHAIQALEDRQSVKAYNILKEQVSG
jgi:hypothetical protein